MQNPFVKWCLSFLFYFSCVAITFGHYQSDWMLEDNTLVLLSDEPETLVSMTGQLQMHITEKDPENQALGTIHYWVLKMDHESFEKACTTAVHCAFQSPWSIRHSLRGSELTLTGDYNEEWLHENIGQTITLSGYLWHAHTTHHHTPVMMDADPWCK